MVISGRGVFFAAIAGIFLLFSTPSAFAQEALTRNNVKVFIEETTAITSRQNKEISDSDIGTYLQKHLDENARFKSVVTFNLPGFPPQERQLSLDKEEFIEQTLSGEQALNDYKTKIRVGSVKISKDGTRASVKTTGRESGTMIVAGPDGAQEVPLEGTSSCDQILKMTNGVIQMYNANCKTEITFEEF